MMGMTLLDPAINDGWEVSWWWWGLYDDGLSVQNVDLERVWCNGSFVCDEIGGDAFYVILYTVQMYMIKCI